MPIQIINTGTSANSGNGDSIRLAFTKVNDNFSYVDSFLKTDAEIIERTQDIVGNMFTTSTNIGIVSVYNDTTGKISLSIDGELAQDLVAAMFTSSNSVIVGYNDTTGKISLAVDSTPSFLNMTSSGTIYQGVAYDGIEYPDTAIRVDGNTEDFIQVIMKNHNSGTNASTDLVIMNNLGNDDQHYIDLGINSSNYSAAMYGVNGTNDGYLYVNGGDLSIGTQTPGTRLVFHAGGTTEMDAGGHLDTEWHFNRPVIVELDQPGVAEFLVWNTSNDPSAASFYEARNGNGGYVRLGVNSHFATYNPDEVYLYPQGPGETFHIGNTTDIKFYANTSTGNTGTATLTLDKDLQSAIFDGHVLPTTDLAYDLGSADKQWRSLYVSTSTIFIGGVPLTINTASNTLVVGTSTNTSTVTLATEEFVQQAISQGGGGGLPTVTVPGEVGTTYKGLQVSYGMVHSNSSNIELNVNKIVIHKPAITTTTIDPTSGQDDFEVTGLGDSDVLAMFVLYGDVNGPKALSTLRSFAEAAIDNVILDGGVEGDYNTVEQMKTAFYTNYSTLFIAAGGLDQDFEFFSGDVSTSVGTTTVREGSGAVFDISVSGGGSALATITTSDLATATASGSMVKNADNIVTPGGWDNWLVFPDSALRVTLEGLFTMNQVIPVQWGTGSTSPTGFIMIQFPGDGTFQITPVEEGGGSAVAGTWYFDVALGAILNTYNASGIQNNGTNYLQGHKILVLGTDLGGATPDNDCIVTVDSIFGSGEIFTWSVSGVPAGTEPAMYGAVTGTNYQTGSGVTVGSINPNNFVLNLNTRGSDYVADDQVTLLGSDLQNGTSPANDIVIRIITVDGSGAVQSWEYLSGTIPQGTWPSNSISDGGNDQYDTANYINSSLASQIAYNGGNTVADGATEFGTGSSYTFVYDTGIFGLLVTGNQSTSIGTSGGSGADGSSITEAGNLYGPNTAEQTFDNAVTHINLIGDPYAGPIVSFTHTDNGNEVDILIPDDGLGAGVGITRSNNQGIYNPYRDEGWSNNVSPSGIGWNIDGWADLSDVESRTYTNLYAAFGFGGLGNKIVGTECVIYLPDNGKYYAVKFDSWTQNNNGGGFAYTRRELDLTNLSEGIRFTDGTRLKSAEGLGRVKLESPGSRRIEEAHGYKSVSVTAITPGVTQNAVIRQSSNNWDFYVNATPELTQLYNNQNTFNYLEFSFDAGNTWIKVRFGGGQPGVYYQMVFDDNVNRPVTADDVVSYRTVTGGTPVIWWSAADLPGGSANFRGAVIDYHAFTSDGTIIGTIHIVDDDGEENITHTEVSSGGTNLENDDLWFVQNEGTISYRRIDGAGRTLKVQWTAKVFYGSEIYD